MKLPDFANICSSIPPGTELDDDGYPLWPDGNLVLVAAKVDQFRN